MTVVCISTNNTASAPCTVITNGTYGTNACVTGNSTVTGSNAVVATCPAGFACSNGANTPCQTAL